MKKALTLLFAAACLCFFSGCKEEKKTSAGQETSSGNPLTAPTDYLDALGKQKKSAETTLIGAGLDQAIKRFYVDEGRMPKDLNELVTKGAINQIPPPPRGTKYDYDPKSGIVKIVPE